MVPRYHNKLVSLKYVLKINGKIYRLYIDQPIHLVNIYIVSNF